MVSQGSRNASAWMPAVVIAALLAPPQAGAVSITFSATQLFGSSWRYDYVIENDGALANAADITGVQVFFDPAGYENLAVVAAPQGWDLIVFEPDADIFLPGVLDGLANPGPGIPAGTSLGGFAVSFDWLAAGEPGAQPFVIYEDLTGSGCDAETEDCFPILFPDGGLPPDEAADFACGPGSTCTEAAVIPAPPAFWLGLTAVSALLAWARRRAPLPCGGVA